MLTRTMHTYLSNEVFERPPGNSVISNFMGLGQVGVEDIHTHTEVRLIEVIGDIPANLQGQEEVFSSFVTIYKQKLLLMPEF